MKLKSLSEQTIVITGATSGIGLVTALLTLATAVAIRRSYTGALVEALRAGRPRVFDRTPGPLAHSLRTAQPDAEAIRTLTASLRSDDIHVRRLAFELLADWRPDPRPVELLQGLHDDDPSVRLAVVRSLDLSYDPSTSLFMEVFYKHLRGGATKAEALRLARTEIMESTIQSDAVGRLAAPYYWAPFVLIGESN